MASCACKPTWGFFCLEDNTKLSGLEPIRVFLGLECNIGFIVLVSQHKAFSTRKPMQGFLYL